MLIYYIFYLCVKIVNIYICTVMWMPISDKITTIICGMVSLMITKNSKKPFSVPRYSQMRVFYFHIGRYYPQIEEFLLNIPNREGKEIWFLLPVSNISGNTAIDSKVLQFFILFFILFFNWEFVPKDWEKKIHVLSWIGKMTGYQL